MHERLEDMMTDLRELDRLRRESAALRDEGYHCLQRWVAKHPVAILLDKEANPDSQDIQRVSAVTRALQRWNSVPTGSAVPTWIEDAIRGLERLSLKRLAGTRFYVRQAAMAMQALAAAPSSAFSPAVLYCYYLMIREIYSLHGGESRIGAARLGLKGLAGAFMTGECIRALLVFERAQRNTAKLFRDLARIHRGLSANEHFVPIEWLEAERRRSSLSFYTTLRRASANLAVRLYVQSPTDAIKFSDGAPINIKYDILEARKVFAEAADQIRRYRDTENEYFSTGNRKGALDRSHLGHVNGLAAVEKAKQNAEAALSHFAAESDEGFDGWERLASEFERAANEVHGLLDPALSFVSSVLDREVFLARSGRNYDPSELVCAATAYGAASDHWADERLVTAATELAKVVPENGAFPQGRPVHVDEDEHSHQLYGGILLRVFAYLQQHADAAVSPHVVARMLHFFQRTGVRLHKEANLDGWRLEWGKESDPVVTATAVQALDRINRMLDACINKVILKHFTVKRFKNSDLGLNDLFATDHGLRSAPPEIRRDESAFIVLERLRAHVAGIRVPPETSDSVNCDEPICSVVLHGPPGTGKTTLLEALAATCGVPMVEVTPSDIVIRGEDSIEDRARTVFEALALLTNVIIMLDEFDPVLWRRESSDPSPRSVFSFLTPGMLPKLKELHKQARRRHMAYGLITNLVGCLDPAAIREGRFDLLLGIFPPDPVSRTGRFRSELLKHKKFDKQSEEQCKRANTVIAKTAGAGMPALARAGWFIAPKEADSLRAETPFAYVIFGGTEPRWPEDEADRVVQGRGKIAERENKQWRWIKKWDDAVASSFDEGLKRPPEDTPDPVFPKSKPNKPWR